MKKFASEPDEARQIVKGGLYRHYKGQIYRALDIVRHSENQEELVLYEALYENRLCQLWVRPKAMFLGDIEIGGVRKRRFEPMADSSSGSPPAPGSERASEPSTN